MILHKKFLMLYLAGINVQCRWLCNEWSDFNTIEFALDAFTYDDYEFRISPNQPQESTEDA